MVCPQGLGSSAIDGERYLAYAINRERRRFVGAAALTLAATELEVRPLAGAHTGSKLDSPPRPEKSGMNAAFSGQA